MYFAQQRVCKMPAADATQALRKPAKRYVKYTFEKEVNKWKKKK